MLVKHAYELVGNTPLIELTNLEKELDLKAKIFAKVESFNPAGSVKDRVALNMILDAEDKGILKSGATIIEPTSGNTGIGLASIGAMRGYKVILTMPSSMSKERIMLLKAYGAEVVLTEASLGMKGSLQKADELNKEIPNSVILGQFVNPANPEMHYKTTGPEIYNDLNGQVDYLVAGIGTGGTISGTGRYLKEKNPNVKVIGVEPFSSPLLTKGTAGPHKIQGIGANFVPDTLDQKVYDEIMDITNEESMEFARILGKKEGFLVGISSGAALSAAIKIAKKEDNKNKNIVVIFPDGGDRYLSTELFNE
ncbi:MAG: cysteine synthase A [Erysipelotrichaceae bacterium]|nr:cysteine synthase A [Erysipelotrichaceae bacterium]